MTPNILWESLTYIIKVHFYRQRSGRCWSISDFKNISDISAHHSWCSSNLNAEWCFQNSSLYLWILISAIPTSVATSPIAGFHLSSGKEKNRKRRDWCQVTIYCNGIWEHSRCRGRWMFCLVCERDQWEESELSSLGKNLVRWYQKWATEGFFQ